MPAEGFGPHKNEFKYEEPEFRVTDEVRKAFEKKGFIIIRNLMDNQEVEKIKKALEEYGLVENYSYGVPDGKGREPKVMIWSHPGNDVLGMVPRTPKVASTCEQLMGGDEMYHYHTKIMMKDAKKGGGFNWHQDYGYWYKNGNLKPDLMSLFMAVDPCVKENGGLENIHDILEVCVKDREVLVGSHLGGRLDHNFEGGQQGLDPERMEHVFKAYEHFYVNLQPGDGLFFHCNLLHGSGPNDSAMRRWAFNCSFNKKSNNPYKVHHHPQYVKLNKVTNSAVKDCDVFYDPTGKDFLDPAIDETVKVGTKQGEKMEQ